MTLKNQQGLTLEREDTDIQRKAYLNKHYSDLKV